METRQSDPEFARAVIELFPRLSPTEQQVSVTLYRLLAQGRPVARQTLAKQVGLSVAQVGTVLDAWYGVFYDDAGEIIGYWGLALGKMNHRLRINGQALYAWCAWDTLFLPQIIGAVAKVESTCPVSGDTIRLTVAPTGIEAASPAAAVISFVTPQQSELKENVLLNFCHYVHFFRSVEAATTWLEKHSGTRLLTLDEAWALGSEKNAAQYGALLDSWGTAATRQAAEPLCCYAG